VRGVTVTDSLKGAVLDAFFMTFHGRERIGIGGRVQNHDNNSWPLSSRVEQRKLVLKHSLLHKARLSTNGSYVTRLTNYREA